MRKKTYSAQFMTFNFFLILFSVLYFLFSVECFAQVEKITKFTPRYTELLSQKNDTSDKFVSIKTYKFGTTNTKEKVLEFYQQLFKNEGFSELEGYSPEKKPLGPKTAYFFTKPGKLAMLNLVGELEKNQNIYYVTLSEPDAKAIKNFTQEEPE